MSPQPSGPLTLWTLAAIQDGTAGWLPDSSNPRFLTVLLALALPSNAPLNAHRGFHSTLSHRPVSHSSDTWPQGQRVDYHPCVRKTQTQGQTARSSTLPTRFASTSFNQSLLCQEESVHSSWHCHHSQAAPVGQLELVRHHPLTKDSRVLR